MSNNINRWIRTDAAKPAPDSRVEWIAPSGDQVAGRFHGGLVWFPKGSDMYVYYTPVMWRYAEGGEP